MPSRIAIVGAAGQLGSDLRRLLAERGVPLTRAEVDVSRPDSVAAALERVQPDAVINAAAYNFVDRAESEPQSALEVNALGPLHLARECARRGIPLLHVSTDYVFGAEGARQRPYGEAEPTGPVSVYGASKAAGEQLVRLAAPRHFIVRTCGLYGRPPAGGKGNFVQTILRLAAEKPELRVVDDQRCTPTSSADLAAALLRLIETDQWGTYHATAAGECSWFEFAREIIRLRGLAIPVIPASTAEFPRPARRPAYSVLDCSRLDRVLGGPLRAWQTALAEYLADDQTA
jgi:dTDP-4-dehydrorhamnose reductase